jgi:hypothetical protein
LEGIRIIWNGGAVVSYKVKSPACASRGPRKLARDKLRKAHKLTAHCLTACTFPPSTVHRPALHSLPHFSEMKYVMFCGKHVSIGVILAKASLEIIASLLNYNAFIQIDLHQFKPLK